jgi:putative hemolysin
LGIASVVFGIRIWMQLTQTKIQLLDRQRRSATGSPRHAIPVHTDLQEGKYRVKLAERPDEVIAALRLRHKVFAGELGSSALDESGLEYDAYDRNCRHLIALSDETGQVVGTYRINTVETAGGTEGFYSASEFDLDGLPREVLTSGMEIGRACIAPEHRNTRVLFLLWKGLNRCLQLTGKRYLFGCCSMFTLDEREGAAAYRQLQQNGHVHPSWRAQPRAGAVDLNCEADSPVELPSLFNTYLRIGATVCGPPLIDELFGSIDFFVVFDSAALTPRYQRMFG